MRLRQRIALWLGGEVVDELNVTVDRLEEAVAELRATTAELREQRCDPS